MTEQLSNEKQEFRVRFDILTAAFGERYGYSYANMDIMKLSTLLNALGNGNGLAYWNLVNGKDVYTVIPGEVLKTSVIKLTVLPASEPGTLPG